MFEIRGIGSTDRKSAGSKVSSVPKYAIMSNQTSNIPARANQKFQILSRLCIDDSIVQQLGPDDAGMGSGTTSVYSGCEADQTKSTTCAVIGGRPFIGFATNRLKDMRP